MTTLRNVLPAFALLALCAGCLGPEVRWQSPTGVTPMDAGTSDASVLAPRQVREVRYYRDESGALWDDRGRKLEPGEKPIKANAP